MLSTPIWTGSPRGIAQRVLERLDAEISETDDEGRMLTCGKVACDLHVVAAGLPAQPPLHLAQA